MEDAVGVMHAASESSLQFLDKLPVNDLVHHATCFEQVSSSLLRGSVISQASLFHGHSCASLCGSMHQVG